MRIYARRRLKRYWSWLLLLVLLCLGLLCVAVLLLLQGLTNMPGVEFVAVDLQSELEADYRADESRPRLPGVQFDLLWAAVADRDPDALDLAARQAALESSLLTPVPTVTPSGSCRGVHFVYAAQDIWLDAANPTTGAGKTTHLSVGQAQGQPQRLLLYFPVTDVLPPGTTIHSARLEMDVAQAGPPEDIRFWSLNTPFDEQGTTWANQPQPVSAYRTTVLANGSIHVWEATVMVRDWLSRQQPNNGLMLEYAFPTETTVVYYSREIISQVEEQNGRIGPRLVINCGQTPATAVSFHSPDSTPLPAATPNPLASGTPAATLPLQTPTLPPPTPTVAPTLLPSPSPSLAPPTPTALPPTPTVPPTVTARPPSPTSPPPPPPTSTPVQDDDDDDDDNDDNDDNDDGPDETPPPPSPTPFPSSTPPLPVADLSVTKFVDNPTPLIGETVTFTITIANAGPLDATNVQLRDLLPTGLVFVSATPNQGSYNEATGLWSVGPIANGGATSLTVTTMAVSNLPVTNVAQIAAVDQPDPDSLPDNDVDVEDDQASVLITSILPTLSINDVTVTEGDSGVVTATFTVLLSQNIALPVMVDYGATDNTATAPADYDTTSGTLIFPPGIISQTLTVQVQGDTLDEVMETYALNLSNAVNATIADGVGLGTIVDDDNPTLSIADTTLIEGDLGSVSAVFTVTLSTTGVETATVNFNTADSTALAPADYAATTGSITFPPGVTQQTIIVPVLGDVVVEGNETFFVNLSNPANATIADGQGLGLIIDDDSGSSPCDAPVSLFPAIADTTLRSNQPNENRGLSTILETKPNPSRRHALIQFDISAIPPGTTISCASLALNQLSPPETNQIINVYRVTRAWVEGDGPPGTTGATWTQPDKAAAPNWIIPGGQFALSIINSFRPDTTLHAIDITPLAQFWVDNPTQNFGLILWPRIFGVNTNISYASREDGLNPPPRLILRTVPDLSLADASVTEGNSGSTTAFFDVSLSSTSTQTVTVTYTTADGTATGVDNDYVPVSGLLTFPPGTITQTIAVTINGDLNSESDETFFVNLSSPVNSGLVDGQAVGTIINDESGGMVIIPEPGAVFLPMVMR